MPRATAVATAAATVRDLRVAEVMRQDVTIENGKVSELPHASRDLVQVRHRRLVRILLRGDATGVSLAPLHRRAEIGRLLTPGAQTSRMSATAGLPAVPSLAI